MNETRISTVLLRDVLWRRLDEPSFEVCRLVELPDLDGVAYSLQGVVLTVVDSRPYHVQYVVYCDRDWVTGGLHVHTTQGDVHRQLQLRRDTSGSWWRDDELLSEFDGLMDIDLSVTPSTNTLPIRRMGLSVGAAAPTDAVWVRFPELTLQRLAQRYTRVAELRYAYESAGGSFKADIDVDEQGVVVRYGQLWERVAS